MNLKIGRILPGMLKRYLLSLPMFDIAQGRLLGRMEGLGFEFKSEANLNTLTHDVVKSSAIEGENLDPNEVRSSIARRFRNGYCWAHTNES